MEGNYIPGCTPGRLHQVHRLSPIDFEFSITEFKLVICSIFLVLVDWYLGGGGWGFGNSVPCTSWLLRQKARQQSQALSLLQRRENTLGDNESPQWSGIILYAPDLGRETTKKYWKTQMGTLLLEGIIRGVQIF